MLLGGIIGVVAYDGPDVVPVIPGTASMVGAGLFGMSFYFLATSDTWSIEEGVYRSMFSSKKLANDLNKALETYNNNLVQQCQ